MERREHDHEIRPVSVDAVYKPPERHLGPQEVNTVIGVFYIGDIEKQLEYSGHNLQEEDRQKSTPEGVGKAAAPGDLFVERQVNEIGQGPSFVKPLPDT